MYDFEYHRPTTIEEAAKLLTAPDSKLLAGGMSLLPTMKLRLTRYGALVDIGKLEGLQGIRREGNTLVIGAMTRHAIVAASDEVRRAIPALNVLAGSIGDPLVRNRGTIGGSIANADPAADYPSGVLGLGACVVTSQRQIACDGFFTGLFETALQPQEIILEISFPIPEKAGYAKYPNPASRFATVGVFVAQTGGEVRVAVTGAAQSVFRLEQAEAALLRDFAPAALDGIVVSPEPLESDIHASAEYRAHAIVVMAKRAVQAAIDS